MSKKWRTYELKDFAQLRKEGIKPSDFNGEKYIGLEHIGQGNFLLDGIGYASDVTSNKLKFVQGDILYGKIRPYFKKVYRPKFSGICSTDMLIITSSNEKIVTQNYLHQIIKTQEFTDKATETSTGTKMPRADWKSLEKIDFQIPPLPEQKAIANILSAIDDKIENNLAINKTLEDMAMALYKHWFVDFGPFQDGEFVDSELGRIPKGWEVKRLPEISINHNKKRKPISTRERAKIQGKYPYYGATKILDYINEYKFDGEYILLAEDGTVKTDRDTPFLQFIEGQFWVSNHAHVLSGNEFYSNEFLYLSLSNINVTPIITGAVQLKINKNNLESLQFIVPPNNQLTEFENIIIPKFKQIKELENENQSLTQLRDTLLPKLISGEVRLKAYCESGTKEAIQNVIAREERTKQSHE